MIVGRIELQRREDAELAPYALRAADSRGRRYAVDETYGLLTAQVALALAGRGRDEVLSRLLGQLAQREMSRGGE